MAHTLDLRWTLLLLCCLCTACKDPDRKLEIEKQKAAEKIEQAETNVEKVRDDATKKIESAQGAAVDEAKIEATEDIADAKHEVEDAKIEATEKIIDAEQKAKVDPSPQLP